MSIYSEKPWLKHYDSHIPENFPLPDISFLEFLEAGLNANPDRVAFHFQDASCTYRRLNELANRFARFLADRGCVKGDVVSIHLPNTPQYLIAAVGAIKAGCVISSVSPLLTPREIEFQLNHNKARVILTLDALYEHKLLGIVQQLPDLKEIVVTGFDDFKDENQSLSEEAVQQMSVDRDVDMAGKGVIAFSTLISTFPAEKPNVQLTPDDTLLLQYTGGTTGVPKGVVLTHGGLLLTFIVIFKWLDKNVISGLDAHSANRGMNTLCCPAPMFHVGGLGQSLMCTAIGDTQIIIFDPRDTDHTLSQMARIGVTQTMGAPTLSQMLLENPLIETVDLSRLKFWVSGMAPCSVSLLKQMESYAGEGKVVENYAATETPTVTFNPRYGKKKLGSVGVPMPNTKVKIVSTEDGITEMPVNEPGELIVSGNIVMKEYHNNPEANQKAFREIDGDRYFYTGDVARMDEDGYFYIVDRTKDLILVGGFNVYSREVEEVLDKLPEIDLCAVVGRPNPERPGSELVTAIIQRNEIIKSKGEDTLKDEIEAFCRENLAPYKVPKIVEFTDALPLTAVGKLDKKMMRTDQ